MDKMLYEGIDLQLLQDETGTFQIKDLVSGTDILLDYDDNEEFSDIVRMIRNYWSNLK